MTIAPPADIACRDLVEMVTDYLEGTLPPARAAAVQAHLAECEDCTAYVEQMRTTVAVLGRALPEPVDAETRHELMALYRRWQAG